MTLVFGGFYQGKLDYVLEKYNLFLSDVFYCSEDNTSINIEKKIFYNIEKYILALIKENTEPLLRIKNEAKMWKDKIIIANDLSQGVVSRDYTTRIHREETGRALTYLARESECVVRIFCGIGSILK